MKEIIGVLIVLNLLAIPLVAVTCASPSAVSNTLMSESFTFNAPYTLASRGYRIEVGVVSGDIYIYGMASDGTARAMAKRVNVATNSNQWWGIYPEINPVLDGFALDSTETFIYILELDTSNAKFTRINTANGNIVDSYIDSGYKANKDYLKIATIPGTTGIYYSSGIFGMTMVAI